MRPVDRIEEAVKMSLEDAQLSKFVVWEHTQFLDIGSRVFVELVLSNADQINEAMLVFSRLAKTLGIPDFEFLVRAVWKIQEIGSPELARTPDGAIVAATVVPVTVQSDRVQQLVNVLITGDAEISFNHILGHQPDLREIAALVVQNALGRGGASSWNPQTRPRFEVTARMAGDLSRQLPKAA